MRFGKEWYRLCLAQFYQHSLQGMQAEFIHVEADVGNGLPFFHMVGHLASEVKESAERVRTAVKNQRHTDSAKKGSDQSFSGKCKKNEEQHLTSQSRQQCLQPMG